VQLDLSDEIFDLLSVVVLDYSSLCNWKIFINLSSISLSWAWRSFSFWLL